MHGKTLTIMDASTAIVHILPLPLELEDAQIERVEEWIINKGFKLSQVDFMYGDISINDER
jgi:pseudouridine-5'-phosphate glycosidase